MEGDKILVWYELPELYVNQKRFVESKENEIWGNLFSRYICDDAATDRDFGWRRPGDSSFQARVEASTGRGGKVHPCGLVAMSMFTDKFALYRLEGGLPVSVMLDETDLALPGEDDVYDDKLLEHPRPFPERFSVRGKGGRSWLEDSFDVEHFKVWMRTPPSPHVRHLWATIAGPLEAGVYFVNVTLNSPVWTETWKVPEKRFIISESAALGSQGAGRVLGVLCAVFAVFEVVMVALMLALPAAAGSLD
mmetsp:Transcript_10397/g.23518  ORF Transcript_10397/g.23518 Transcript_10397/m.23518 type:complete len:249 (+) Transcript_10397:542-1288(+)